jgi:cytochrome c peroxidase
VKRPYAWTAGALIIALASPRLRESLHNGYLKSRQEVVHFYNTRDTLPRCKSGDRGEKVTCSPAPENPETIDQQEDLLVAFLKTLTDGCLPEKRQPDG